MLSRILIAVLLLVPAKAGMRFPFSYWKSGSVQDANTLLLLPFDTGSTITDISQYNNSAGWAITGVGVVDGTNPKFGSGSWDANGASHQGLTYISRSDATPFAMGSGDFTIDFWVYSSNYTGIDLIGLNAASGIGWEIGVVGAGGTTPNFRNATQDVAAPSAPTTDAWHHIAVVRSSGTVKVYLDGTGGTGATDSTNYTNSGFGFRVGADGAWHGSANAYIDELRISNVARWTSNFTPPSAPY